MPDIALLPSLAENFGVSIDDLFDLTAEQRMNRIENRLDMEDDLPQDIFLEYEDFLKAQLRDDVYQKRAAELIAYLYWHRMEMFSGKAAHYAREAVRLSPGEKGSQWVLNKAEGHAAWDWNMANHTAAIEFYRDLVRENPDQKLPYEYLLDNLIADHRADEADRFLDRLCKLKDFSPILGRVYRAHIALARFDEKTADGIMERLLGEYPDDPVCLFEAAQYYAKKASYAKAIGLYERSFEKTARRPRFRDELMGISDICEIMGDYEKAADTCDRIIELLKTEWGITEGDDLKNLQEKKARLLEKAGKRG
ncbi:MAG: hypothetical protein J5564_03190 [Clostridia bacterium]|nr:hypothetical protein [Clostridia bacterium]